MWRELNPEIQVYSNKLLTVLKPNVRTEKNTQICSTIFSCTPTRSLVACSLDTEHSLSLICTAYVQRMFQYYMVKQSLFILFHFLWKCEWGLEKFMYNVPKYRYHLSNIYPGTLLTNYIVSIFKALHLISFKNEICC